MQEFREPVGVTSIKRGSVAETMALLAIGVILIDRQHKLPLTFPSRKMTTILYIRYRLGLRVLTCNDVTEIASLSPQAVYTPGVIGLF